MKLKTAALTVVILLTLTGISFGSAFFKGTPTDSFCSNNDLCVSFDEVGAGDNPTYMVTATVNASYCLVAPATPASKSFTIQQHNNVDVKNKDTGIGAAPTASVSGSGTLAKISYTSVTLTDTSNNVSASLSNLGPKTVASCP